jgi:hypothetical protein
MRPLPSAETLNLNLIYNPFDGSLCWRISGEEFGNKHADGYISGNFGGVTYAAHRLIYKMMTGHEPQIVDHANGCRSDNRWKNLGNATPLRNARNLGRNPRNTTGHTGVRRSTNSSGFRAYINVKGRRLNLGTHPSFEKAVAARKAAEEKHGFHPNHGRINL